MCAFGSSYAPGSPVSFMIDVDGCCAALSSFDLKAVEPARF